LLVLPLISLTWRLVVLGGASPDRSGGGGDRPWPYSASSTYDGHGFILCRFVMLMPVLVGFAVPFITVGLS